MCVHFFNIDPESDWAANEDQIAQAYVDYKAQEAFNNNNTSSPGRCTLPPKACSVTPREVVSCPSHLDYTLKDGKCIWINYFNTSDVSIVDPITTTVCDQCPGGYHPSGSSCAPDNQGYDYTRAGTQYSMYDYEGELFTLERPTPNGVSFN